uniref:SP-RING-type domain-containing protein n=1 Tax=Mycena chlorophos TaxID=658473 RepID=A0ABQ0LEE9_MYCCL|nr:predicted protein [Mycena chlorophos]
MLFATEGFESYNAIIRACSIHSNRHAPSRDIAWQMAKSNRVRHLLNGGSCVKKGTARLWRETKAAKLNIVCGIDAGQAVRTPEGVILQNGDVCRAGDHIVFNNPPQLGRVEEIIQRVGSTADRHDCGDFLVVSKTIVGELHALYGTRGVQHVSESIQVPILVWSLNRCGLSRTKETRQEREVAKEKALEVEHRSSSGQVNWLLNTHQMRDASVLMTFRAKPAALDRAQVVQSAAEVEFAARQTKTAAAAAKAASMTTSNVSGSTLVPGPSVAALPANPRVVPAPRRPSGLSGILAGINECISVWAQRMSEKSERRRHVSEINHSQLALVVHVPVLHPSLFLFSLPINLASLIPRPPDDAQRISDPLVVKKTAPALIRPSLHNVAPSCMSVLFPSQKLTLSVSHRQITHFTQDESADIRPQQFPNLDATWSAQPGSPVIPSSDDFQFAPTDTQGISHPAQFVDAVANDKGLTAEQRFDLHAYRTLDPDLKMVYLLACIMKQQTDLGKVHAQYKELGGVMDKLMDLVGQSIVVSDDQRTDVNAAAKQLIVDPKRMNYDNDSVTDNVIAHLKQHLAVNGFKSFFEANAHAKLKVLTGVIRHGVSYAKLTQRNVIKDNLSNCLTVATTTLVRKMTGSIKSVSVNNVIRMAIFRRFARDHPELLSIEETTEPTGTTTSTTTGRKRGRPAKRVRTSEEQSYWGKFSAFMKDKVKEWGNDYKAPQWAAYIDPIINQECQHFTNDAIPLLPQVLPVAPVMQTATASTSSSVGGSNSTMLVNNSFIASSSSSVAGPTTAGPVNNSFYSGLASFGAPATGLGNATPIQNIGFSTAALNTGFSLPSISQLTQGALQTGSRANVAANTNDFKELITALNRHGATARSISRQGKKADLRMRVEGALRGLKAAPAVSGVWANVRPTAVTLRLVSGASTGTTPAPTTSVSVSLPTPASVRASHSASTSQTPTYVPALTMPKLAALYGSSRPGSGIVSAPAGGGGGAGPSHPRLDVNPGPAFRFKPSPFFTVEEPVSIVHECVESYSAQDRREASFTFTLTAAQLAKLRPASGSASTPPTHQLRLFCTSSAFYDPSSAPSPRTQTTTKNNLDLPIEFPSTCEVFINDTQLKSSLLKGMKRQPGTAPPPDLRVGSGLDGGLRAGLGAENVNKVKMLYVNSTPAGSVVAYKKFYLVVQLVRVERVTSLIENIRDKQLVSAEEIRSKMRASVAASEDDDIIAGTLKLPLKCPLSFARIALPARSRKCTHSQCFDCASWFAVMEQTTTWLCPICENVLDWREIIVDGFFAEILRLTPPSADDVLLEADGTWRTPDGRYSSRNPYSAEKKRVEVIELDLDD